MLAVAWLFCWNCVIVANEFSFPYNEDRTALRQTGYCLKQCDLGTDLESDGFLPIMRWYFAYKSSELFEEFHERIDSGDDSKGEIPEYHLFREFCEMQDISFESCFQYYRRHLQKAAQQYCLSDCMEEYKSMNVTPAFDDIALITQDFETCLSTFQGPQDNFQAHPSKVDQMADKLYQNGFVVIENFFRAELMEEIATILNDWRETGEWNNLQYSAFSGIEHLHTSTNRLEVVLPYVQPFTTLLTEIQESTILYPLLRKYSTMKMTKHPMKIRFEPNNETISVEFVSSILSRPGAPIQSRHSDFYIPQVMLKLNVAIHKMEKKDGPTGFCPCTHKWGHVYDLYGINCLLHYQPNSVEPGTLTVYDQALMHQGMANDGETVRSIVDLSYIVGPVASGYADNFPEEGQDHIEMYRKNYGS